MGKCTKCGADLVNGVCPKACVQSEVKTLSMADFDAMLKGKLDERLNPLFESLTSVNNKLNGTHSQEDPKVVRRLEHAEALKNILGACMGDPESYVKVAEWRKRAKALDMQNSSSLGDGGYLVPEEFMAEILRLVPTYGIARRDCRIIPMRGNTKRMPALASSLVPVWLGEGETKSIKKFTLKQVQLVARKLACIVPATDEMLDDSAINIFTFLSQILAEAFGLAEDTALFRGNGGTIPGIFGTANIGEVVSEGAVVTGVTADDLNKMIYGVPTAGRGGAKFYLNPTMLGVVQRLKDLNKNYIWQGPAGNKPGTIWNYPYEETDAMPAVTEQSTYYVVFGNLKNVLFGDRQSLTLETSKDATLITGSLEGDDLEVTSLFQNDLKAIRAVERLDIKVGIPEAIACLSLAESS